MELDVLVKLIVAVLSAVVIYFTSGNKTLLLCSAGVPAVAYGAGVLGLGHVLFALVVLFALLFLLAKDFSLEVFVFSMQLLCGVISIHILENSKAFGFMLLLSSACPFFFIGLNWYVRVLSIFFSIGVSLLSLKLNEVGPDVFFMNIGASESMLHSYRVLFWGFGVLVMLLCFFSMCCLFRKEENERKNKEAKQVMKNRVFSVACMTAILLRYNGGYTEKARKLFRDFVEESFSGAELYKAEYLGEAEMRIENLTHKSKINIKKHCLDANHSLSYEEKVSMMRLLYDVAILGGGIYPEERKLLSQIMTHIRISAEQAQIFENTYSRHYYDSRASQERAKGTYTSSGTYIPSRLVEAYAVFGLKPGTALDEVKRVYRRLVFENHPDRLAHADEATRAAAEERTRELNRAMKTIEERF
ncbi:MAG: DnaJ domain-containing protein [Paludibacteraceae bacterium]|nr:DnaJ domain-containing protein [Paludibacteraceae bacterium]